MIYHKIHKILEKLDGILIKLAVKPTEVYQGVMGYDVQNMLSPHPIHKRVLDANYRTYTKRELVDTLNFYSINNHKYVKDEHDCDDFAYEVFPKVRHHLTGCMFGIIVGKNKTGKPHAWNFFIDNDFNMWYIEPQNNTLFKKTTEIVWEMVI